MEEMQLVAPSKSKQLFWIFLLANIIYIVFVWSYLRPFQIGDIVRLETAKTIVATETLVQQWTIEGKVDGALQSIYFDYPFIILYIGLLGSACIFLSGSTGHEILRRAGKLFSFLLPAAGICDVLENVAMTETLQGKITRFTVSLTYDMAMAKFSILILSLLFIVICLIFLALNRIR